MIAVFIGAWALFAGMLLLMIGNGMQGTLLGLRGAIEGFSTLEMSFVISSYFLGFLGGSSIAPDLIRRVGHVRVFAALGSFISAILILYPAITNPFVWMALRVVIGFCFCGVYVTAESWLNNAATNETRGKTLSLYMIVQMAGIVSAQYILLLGDPSGFILFVIPSVLVSISFAPILLSISPTPAVPDGESMSLRKLFRTSPLAAVGLVLVGGVNSAMFGMTAVYATEIGLRVAQISSFVSAFYVGGLVLQYPVGFLSDRIDRRWVILGTAALAALASFCVVILGPSYGVLLVAGFLVGGMANPLYSLLQAYINDYLPHEQMAAAAGAALFANGVGAIAGPIVTGAAMGMIGPQGFWLYISVMMVALVLYGLYRTTRRASSSEEGEQASYAPVFPTASPVATALAAEVYAEAIEEAVEEAEDLPDLPAGSAPDWE